MMIRKASSVLRNSSAFLGGAAATAGALVSALGFIVAREAITSKQTSPEDVRVIAVTPDPAHPGSGEIELQRTVESETAGRYTVHWAGRTGRAFLDETLTATASTLTRRYSGVIGTPIELAQRVRVVSSPHRGVQDLGLAWSDVVIPTELGPAPAWFVPAEQPTGKWMIHVHGRGASRSETLRTVPLAHARGWNSLVISYRNDPGAPAARGRRYGLGLTEWRDVDAALEWARSRGAEKFLLAGWSMGGTIVGQTYLRSGFAGDIVGLMLESPGVDWRATINYQPAMRFVPEPAKKIGRWLLRSRLGTWALRMREPIDLDEIDLVARANELEVPVLLLHSTEDTVVPVGPSRDLAHARPELVRYEEFSGARHVRLWNRQPERWELAVGQWLDDRTAALALGK